MLWLKMFVGKKWVSLLCCLDAAVMMKSVLLALSLSLLFDIQSEILLRQSPSGVREIYVFAVNKVMHTWVSSAYNWWPNLWLWIRERNAVLQLQNSSSPITAKLGNCLWKTVLYLYWLKPMCYEWADSSECCDRYAIPIKESRLRREQNNQCFQKLQIKLTVLVLWLFLCPCLVMCRCELSVELFL